MPETAESQARDGEIFLRTEGAARFRRDIQAMRALAVSGVVVNHVWPGLLPGGYVGVDVFFVISGYLITSHLERDIARFGRVRLLTFYGRRASRLLPAAFLVTLSTLVALWAWVPFSVWERNVGEAIAATSYVENFHLVALSVNYMAHDEAASAFQHYWSLSAEEQFYLVWPVLLSVLAAASGWGARTYRAHDRRLLGFTMLGIGAVLLLSLLASVIITSGDQPAAYFLTWTRAWEFAAGALVALLARRHAGQLVARPTTKKLIALAGWAAMAAAMVTFDEDTVFPGATALLPVVGAAAVIAAGEGSRSTPLRALTNLGPVQFVGEVSYAIYLWHWPLLVVLPYALGGRDARTQLAVVGLTIVLAWLTRRHVELPMQRAKRIQSRGRLLLPLTAASMAVVMLAAWSLGQEGHRREAIAGQLLVDETSQPCLGAAALDATCGDPYARPLISPVSNADKTFTISSSCVQNPQMTVGDGRPRWDCDLSGGRANAPRVWLVGDSHAQQLFPALGRAAVAGRWRVTGIAIGGCVPFPVHQAPGGIPGRSENVCPGFGPAIDKAVRDERPDVVLVAISSRHETLDDGSGESQESQYVRHLAPTIAAWTRAGVHVLGVSDNPFLSGRLDASCTNQHLTDLPACSAPRSQVVQAWSFERAVDTMSTRTPGLGRISLVDHICDPLTCRSVVGGLNVLHDTNHLSAVYSRTLGPYLYEAVRSKVPGLRR